MPNPQDQAETIAEMNKLFSKPENQPSMENLLANVRSRNDLIKLFNQPKVETAALVPPEPTGAMRNRIAAEQEAGKAALQRHADSRAAEVPPKKSAAEKQAEGSTNPVQRPGDFVPNMKQGQTQGRSIR